MLSHLQNRSSFIYNIINGYSSIHLVYLILINFYKHIITLQRLIEANINKLRLDKFN
jgi:hypothetical protein